MKFTEIVNAVYVILMFLWIFPALRQYGNKFFYFFLILAMADPISLFSKSVFNYNINVPFFFFTSYLLLISIQTKETIIKKRKLIIIVLILVISSLFMNFPINLYNGGMIIIYILIFFQFFVIFVKTNVEEKAVDIFLVILMFYALTSILKLTNLFFGLSNAIAYFYLTTIFQLLIGLYFSIFKADNPKNLIKINI